MREIPWGWAPAWSPKAQKRKPLSWWQNQIQSCRKTTPYGQSLIFSLVSHHWDKLLGNVAVAFPRDCRETLGKVSSSLLKEGGQFAPQIRGSLNGARRNVYWTKEAPGLPPQITICRNDECVLKDNAQRTKWRVISPAGNEATVPSVCFLVPPPNREAIEMASR